MPHPPVTIADLLAALATYPDDTPVFVGWTETHDVDSLQPIELVFYPAEGGGGEGGGEEAISPAFLTLIPQG